MKVQFISRPKLFTYALLAMAAMLVLCTCRKEEDEECPCQYDQGFQQVKDWMYFKTGSYWIYEEENSGLVDTLTVYEDWEGISQDVNESFYTFTNSSYNEYNYKYRYNESFSNACTIQNGCFCEKVERSKTKPGDFVGASRIFAFPPIDGNYLYNTGRINISEINSGIQIGVTHYNYAAKYSVEIDDSEDQQEVIYTVSKHVGIIRKELIEDNEVWNLIEYNVIQ